MLPSLISLYLQYAPNTQGNETLTVQLPPPSNIPAGSTRVLSILLFDIYGNREYQPSPFLPASLGVDFYTGVLANTAECTGSTPDNSFLVTNQFLGAPFYTVNPVDGSYRIT